MRWLKQTWSGQWLREPTADEFKGLVNDLVSEELMAREAQEMGLDKDDTIIRRRLAQKLKFLVEDTARLVEPTESELGSSMPAMQPLSKTLGKVSFRQSISTPGEGCGGRCDRRPCRSEIEAQEVPAWATGCCLAMNFEDIDELSLSGMFGPDFASVVFALTPGEWKWAD